MLKRVISGGQTGVEQVALRAAKALGIETGGWAPIGWKTEEGESAWLGAEYGLEIHKGGFEARIATTSSMRMSPSSSTPECTPERQN